ncbi:MAG: PQQ-binding-like beta-propeller repeat protein [Terriglobales bacterium]
MATCCDGAHSLGSSPRSPRFHACGRLFRLTLFVICAAGLSFATDVVTYHNDIFRTGQNLQETILTESNVNSTSFGKLFTLPVDNVIDAEPLYLSELAIPGKGTHNVVYAVTENDSVYAFDADQGTLLWQVSVLGSGETPSDTHNCGQISPVIGITSTPVIDRHSGPHGTIYVVAMSKKGSSYFQRIHALDAATGKEQPGAPITVAAKYPGTGDGSQGGYVVFAPEQYAERQGLLLLNGVLYTAWTSHCDERPYTGWIIAYNATTGAQAGVLDLTPNGNEGAIWQAGAGMASDGKFIYLLDANGTFDTTLNGNGFPANGDFGNAFVKISTVDGKVKDYFTMYNTVQESDGDVDLGSGGAMLLPAMKDAQGNTRYLAIGAGKDQNLYIVDRDNMGKFNPQNDDAVYQELDDVLGGGVWSMPAYFNGNVYYGPVGNNLLQFSFTNARLSTSPVAKSAASFTYPGSTPSVSANGSQNGIVWAIEHSDPNDVLHAYNASSVSQELYNSNQASNGRDSFGTASHFGTPMIVNGKVYVGTQNGVVVFGLLQGKK